ncbi:MAG: hypothetical protein ACOC5C_03400 [Halobacteriota archaeon]
MRGKVTVEDLMEELSKSRLIIRELIFCFLENQSGKYWRVEVLILMISPLKSRRSFMMR